MDQTEKKRAILEMLTKIAREHKDEKLFQLPAKEVKRLCGFFYILQDIEMALKTTKKLREMISQHNNDDVDKGGVLDVMWYGILITYSRCFTNNKGGLTTIDQSIFSTRRDLIPIHNRIWTTRNTFIAHREDTNMLTSTMVVALPNSGKPSYILEVQRKRFWQDDLEEYIDLLSFIETNIHEKIEREKSRISKFLNSVTAEQAQAMMISNSIKGLLKDLNKTNRAQNG